MFDRNVSPLRGGNGESGDLNRTVRRLEDRVNAMAEELRYAMSHVDTTNMTQELVDTIRSNAGRLPEGTTKTERFLAGLTLDGVAYGDRLKLALSSRGVQLGSVTLSLDPVRTVAVQAALESAYPVGSVFVTASDEDAAEQLGFGTWEEIDAGVGALHFYRRKEDA